MISTCDGSKPPCLLAASKLLARSQRMLARPAWCTILSQRIPALQTTEQQEQERASCVATIRISHAPYLVGQTFTTAMAQLSATQPNTLKAKRTPMGWVQTAQSTTR